MPQVVVLLRGVNVGGRNRVPMAAFRAVLETLGLQHVRTLLNSGNAVAQVRARDWDRLAQAIRIGLADAVQVDVPVIVVPADTLHAIVAGNPISAADINASQLLVAFAQAPATLLALSGVSPLLVHDEEFVTCSHAAYLYCAQGIRDSKAANALLGRIGQSVTTRNWATVLKLHALLEPTDT
jgi:uncharacterized protein (DUF1697 family)